MDQTTINIARAFGSGIQEALNREQFARLIDLNACEEDYRICHSHDFCDANQVFADAFITIVGRDIDTQSDADVTTWSDAWALAKEAKFYV